MTTTPYQWDRLAAEFGVISCSSLNDTMTTEIYTPEQLAAMCSTKPETFAQRLAFWQSAEAPTAPPVITIN